MGERCSDTTQLSDYGISEPFIKQVAAYAEPECLGLSKSGVSWGYRRLLASSSTLKSQGSNLSRAS